RRPARPTLRLAPGPPPPHARRPRSRRHVRRASATPRSPRRSRWTGRYRGRRRHARVHRAPVVRRPATCRRVRPVPVPVGQVARRVPVGRRVPVVVPDPVVQAVGRALRQVAVPAAGGGGTTPGAPGGGVAAGAVGRASVAVLPVHSDVPAVRRDVAASRSGRNAPNTRTCRPRSSVV